MNRKLKIGHAFVIGGIAFALLLAGGWLMNYWLIRADRIHVDLEGDRILKLRDCIILFAKDRKRFPEKLAELLPGYCSEKELEYLRDPQSDQKSTYTWNPETGELSWAAPFRITGLYSDYEVKPEAVKIQTLTVKENPLNGENVFSQPQNNQKLGQETVVLDPENMQGMTYGWQIGESAEASGGAYLHIKEGMGDFESEDKIADFPAKARSGDFYNLGHDQRRIKAEMFFQTPKAGTYFIYARTMAQRSSCSNMTYLKVNNYREVQVGHNGSQPFTWRWHRIGRFRLKKGINEIALMAHQDGVRVDQLLLSPKRRINLEPEQTFSGGFENKRRNPPNLPSVNFSFSSDTLNITKKLDPQVYIYVHKNIPGTVEARMEVQLDLPRGRVRNESHKIKLDKELTRFPCKINLPRPLDRKEYLLKATLFIAGKKIEERTLVLFHCYDWQILGPLPYMSSVSAGPVEKDAIPKQEYKINGKTYKWRQYDEKYTEQFGMLDFGMMFSGRTYYALNDVCLYAYTEVDVSEPGTYLLKLQADDNIVVWVNGEKVAMITEKGPPIRTAKEVKVALKQGKNRILFRLNQKTAQWQAGVRIRTEKYGIAKGVQGKPAFSAW